MDSGQVTADGCAVDLYLLLPPNGEPEIVHSAVAPGASVLELGSGPGRITHPLLDLGHKVVAVDDSAAMLAHVRGETVCSRIGDLALGRTFDAVLLGSHLVNTPDDTGRQQLLDAARRHLAPDGQLLVEWHPPAWFGSVEDGQGGLLGEVDLRLTGIVRDRDLLSATVRYSARDSTWEQPFTVRRIDLDVVLPAAGLVFDRWLTVDRTWFAARRRG